MKRGIIIASFGTTFDKTRELTIEALENEARKEFKDDLVLRAFTSTIVSRRLRDRGMEINSVRESLEIMKEKDIKEIYIQPSHIMEGFEYEKILREVEEFNGENTEFVIKVGRPLLSTEKDYEKAVMALDLGELEEDQALIFMGHGSDHENDKVYTKLEDSFHRLGYENVFVGTVEGAVTIEDIYEKIKSRPIKNIELRPFMFVAGDHATNDMASDDEDSWKTYLKGLAYDVEARILGLGEFKTIRQIFIEHLKEIM